MSDSPKPNSRSYVPTFESFSTPLNEAVRGSKGAWKWSSITFDELARIVSTTKSEGIVLLGAGGSADEWIDGVTDVLQKDGSTDSADPAKVFSGIYVLRTTKGRTDLALVFNKKFKGLNIGRMAMWRLQFGDCSWISDYLDNFAPQHGSDYKPYKQEVVDESTQTSGLVVADEVERVIGCPLVMGRMVVKGYPADVSWHDPNITVRGVDGEATRAILKLLRADSVLASRVSFHGPSGQVEIKTK
jgi:hypothetical protein